MSISIMVRPSVWREDGARASVQMINCHFVQKNYALTYQRLFILTFNAFDNCLVQVIMFKSVKPNEIILSTNLCLGNIS